MIVFCINTQYIFEETHLNVNDCKRAGSTKKVEVMNSSEYA